jgi:hypothetical protein
MKPTHPFNATHTIYSVNHYPEKRMKMYLSECGLQLHLVYVFLEGMLIQNAIKIHATSGKQ